MKKKKASKKQIAEKKEKSKQVRHAKHKKKKKKKYKDLKGKFIIHPDKNVPVRIGSKQYKQLEKEGKLAI